MTPVAVRRQGALVHIVLSDPSSGNALGGAMVAALTEALLEAAAPPARAVVISGSGRHFCSGAHLGELAESEEAPFAARLADAERLGRLYAAVLRCPLLTVAALHGGAFGGGAGLAAACDLVVAHPESRLQFSEVRLGFVPALISVFLTRRVTAAALARLFVEAVPLGTAEARAIGLVDDIAEDPLPHAATRAETVAHAAAPSAVAATKQLLLELALPDLDARLALAARANAAQREHEECRRGVAHLLATRSFRDWLEP